MLTFLPHSQNFWIWGIVFLLVGRRAVGGGKAPPDARMSRPLGGELEEGGRDITDLRGGAFHTTTLKGAGVLRGAALTIEPLPGTFIILWIS